MINDFKRYLDHLQEKYGDKDSLLRPEWFPRPFSYVCEGVEINPTNSNIDVKLIKKAPQIIQPLYEFASGILLPFGRIFSIERALEVSKQPPFDKSKWFVFGKDQYFSFWLCSFNEDDKGLSFTSWDHEAHEFEYIEGGWDSVVGFLQFIEEEYDESEAHNAQYDEDDDEDDEDNY